MPDNSHPPIWLLEELWVDPMENQFGNAQGYTPCGYATTKEEADVAIARRGCFIGTGWPFDLGQRIPILRSIKLKFNKNP